MWSGGEERREETTRGGGTTGNSGYCPDDKSVKLKGGRRGKPAFRGVNLTSWGLKANTEDPQCGKKFQSENGGLKNLQKKIQKGEQSKKKGDKNWYSIQ